MKAAWTRNVWRQPIVEIISCTNGAEAARPKPLADWTIEIAMPRRRTKWRESNGTKTTSPRQLAPIVMTIPYSRMFCQRAEISALPSSPIKSRLPPSSNRRRGPNLSTIAPTSGELPPATSWDTE